MTTYNTMNSVPSADARDRYDNSQVFDEYVTGTELKTPDRLGKQRKTIAGMEFEFGSAQDERDAAFQAFLESSGWSSLGVYAAGLSIVSHSQTVDYQGQPYQLKSSVPASISSPYVTTGNWAIEGSNFKLVGDNSLRQELASSSGATKIGTPTGTVQHSLDAADSKVQALAVSLGKSFKSFGMVADYVSPSNRGTVNKGAWKAMFEAGGGRFYGEIGAQYYLGAIAATEILATVTHGQPIFIDLQGGTLWLDMVTPDQGRLTAALIHTTDTPLYCYNGSIRCLTEAVYPTRGIMPFYCNALNKPTRGYGLGDMYIEKMADMFTVAGPMGELVNRISGISFDGHVTANGCYYGFNGQWTGDDVTGAYTSIGANRSYFAYGGSGHDLTVISRDGRNSTGDVIIQAYEKGVTQNINLKIIQINGLAPIKVTFTQDRANAPAQSGMTVRAVKIDATITNFFSGYPPLVVSHQVGDVVQATSNAVVDGLSFNINQDWQNGTASNPQSLVVYTDFASKPRIELNDGARVSLYALNGAALIQNGKTTMSAAARATEFLIPRRMVFNRDTGSGLAIVRFLVSFQGLNAAGVAATAVEEIWAETAIASTGQTTLRTKKNTRLFGSSDTTIYIGLALVGNDYRINITGQSTTYEYNVMCASIEKIAQA